jgi:hypothetical protein
MAPSSLPAEGPIEIRGRVTNRDTVAWSPVDLYPFVSSAPLTSRAELAEAVDVPSGDFVGERILTVEDTVDSLAPGASSTFTLTIPRSALTPLIGTAQPGVYWFGVHAIGESTEVARDDRADGRARTFLPSVPANTQGQVKTSLVMSLRRILGREPDGSLSEPESWQRSLTDQGRLREAVEFGAAATPGQLSWLVDPALLDAVQRLAGGNLPRSLAPTLTPTDPGDEPTDEPTDEGEPEAEEVEPLTEEQETAAGWLSDAESALQGQELLTLPYGDLDLDGAVHHDSALLELAGTQQSAVLQEWGLTGTGVLGSPSGYLDPDTITAIDADVPVLVTDRAFGADPPAVADLEGHKVVVTSSGAAHGGPRPGDRVSGVALRQRILSEAALRVLEPGRDPLVVMMPPGLTSEGATDFFAGLDVPWLDLTTLSDASARDGRPVEPDELAYPDRQRTIELDLETFQAVDGLIADGEALQNLLTLNDRVGGELTEEALAGASFAARQSQLVSRASLNRSRGWVQDQLASVQIGAPPGVTLSSATGDFVATITNRLLQPVTVSVRARSDNGIVVTPPEPVELAADSRTSVLLQARTSEASVHNVTLLLTDTDGTPLGSSDQLPIRSAQVSVIIWVIMGAGVVLLFGAILLRLVRRFRHRNDPPDEPAEPEEPAEAAAPAEAT